MHTGADTRGKGFFSLIAAHVALLLPLYFHSGASYADLQGGQS